MLGLGTLHSTAPLSSQDAYSKRFISVACISRVAAIGDQKFEVITNNRTFAFRAESDGGEWDRQNTSSLA